MTSEPLLSSINSSREEIISSNYKAAFLELQDKVKIDPLRVKFNIYAGCVSEDMTKEIAHRFVAENITATPSKYGLFSTTHYLQVVIALPENLVHKDATEDKPVVETEGISEDSSTEVTSADVSPVEDATGNSE